MPDLSADARCPNYHFCDCAIDLAKNTMCEILLMLAEEISDDFI